MIQIENIFFLKKKKSNLTFPFDFKTLFATIKSARSILLGIEGVLIQVTLSLLYVFFFLELIK